MIKISSIVLLLCISFCSARVGLRDPGHWKAWNNIDLLNQYMGGFNLGGSNKLQADSYLNTLAQAVAETDEDPNEFIRKYPRNGENVLVHGIKLRGDTTYKQILTEDFNSVMQGMPGFLTLRYKNNTMSVRVTELKELMDLTQCDTLAVPLKCNPKACENLWRGGTGEFKFSNGNYNYRVRFNNLLRVFQSMTDSRQDRYSLDLFKNTYHHQLYRNENFEMTFEVPDFFGPGFWSNKETGVWGIGDQAITILTNGGRIRATSEVQHQFLKVNLEVNENFVPVVPKGRLSDEDLRDAIEAQFPTMYEMYDRDQVFKSFTKYGEGYALDSNNNINIVFSYSGPVSNNVRVLDRSTRRNLFNRLKLWPWFVAAPTTVNANPFNRDTMIQTWRRALGLSMGPINQDRLADGLPALAETDPSLTTFAQAAADRFAAAGKFVAPDFSSVRPNTLVVAMTLSGETRINEYDFLLNDNNFGQVTCFDNFSNQKHKIVNLIDNQRYACSKNSGVPQAVSNWKKYNVYGTGHAVTPNGDAFMAIALSF
jgi:hypothetical protein